MNTWAPRQASAKAEKLAQRLSHILAQLHQGALSTSIGWHRIFR